MPQLYTDAAGATIATPAYTLPGFPGQFRTFADLYYNKYRDYDPTTGRYIQADPIGLAGGQSPYSYAMGNPLRYTDPTGEFVPLIPIVGGVIIGVVSGALGDLAIQAGVNAWNGKDIWDPDCYDWKQVAISGGIGGLTGGLGAGFVAARASGKVVAGATDEAFSHGFKYADRVRSRGLQDPTSHNFPYSFDDAILAGGRNSKPNGYGTYQATGTMNGKQGVFEIGVNKNGVIDHRFFRPD